MTITEIKDASFAIMLICLNVFIAWNIIIAILKQIKINKREAEVERTKEELIEKIKEYLYSNENTKK